MSEQLSPFHAAVTAFEIRFESELTDRWQALESEAAGATIGAPSDKKRSMVNRFFKDAEREIGNVTHEYFPKLLQVATTQRQHLRNESPLAWTQAQVLRQVCSFLGVDEKFDPTSPPRDDSRLSVATARIVLGVGWLDEAIPADFVLPSWLDSRWALTEGFAPPASLRSEDAAESLPPLSRAMSRAETLEWIKHREFLISKGLERQIETDSWDGIIEAGKSNVSVLHAFVAAEQEPDGKESTQRLTPPHEHSFVREATTWNITFGEEICRVRTMIGFEYISVLLQNPGEAVRALDLRTRAVGLPADASARLVAEWSEDSGLNKKPDYREGRSWEQSDFGRQEILDDRARSDLKQRLLQIEQEIAIRVEIGDTPKVDQLEKEYATIESCLGDSQGLHGRPRVFSGENEKARTSITKALRRAYDDIQEHAPKTAAHLESNISTGSVFVYLDASRSWKVRRTP
jgi:hypothetical protein